MAEAVFTREKRFQFVKGWLTGGTDPGDGSVECGDGTRFAMRVVAPIGKTKQGILAEIFYRVKTASWTGGEWNGIDIDDTYGFRISNAGSSVHPSFESSTDNFIFRGYGWARGTDSGFVEPYSAPLPVYADKFYEAEAAAHFNVSDTFTQFPIATRDIKANEGGMWYATAGNLVELPSDLIGLHAIYDPAAFRCGFSVEALSGSADPNVSPPYNAVSGWLTYESSTFPERTDEWEFAAQSTVRFSGLVAYIDNAGNGNPFDPANEIYIGVEFGTWTNGTLSSLPYPIGTYVDGAFNFPFFGLDATTTVDFVLELSGGVTLSAPIFATSTWTQTGDSANFVLKATEWWPYAKDAPAVPKWNSATGEKL